MSGEYHNVVEALSALTIGTVEFVSPDEIKVLLALDSPQSTALNTGVPSGFPRINGYLLVPNEIGAVVGMIAWVGIERSAHPKRSGLKDFGLVDLPFPLRKVSLIPVGTLVPEKGQSPTPQRYTLRRGVTTFPSVGDNVLLPTETQLRAIVEAGRDEDRRVAIGTSPLADNAQVTVDPDKLFGRHLAILGNTGSGKSCTVAGLIRWSLAAAKRNAADGKSGLNARFIILDPNGEYIKAFSSKRNIAGDGERQDDDLAPHVFRVPQLCDEQAGEKPLVIPAWMWNSHEWAAFAWATQRTQKPLLMEGLRVAKGGGSIQRDGLSHKIRVDLLDYQAVFEQATKKGAAYFCSYGGSQDVIRTVASFSRRLQSIGEDAAGQHHDTTQGLDAIRDALPRKAQIEAGLSVDDFERVIRSIRDVIESLPDEEPMSDAPCEDTPIPFSVSEFPDRLERLAKSQGNRTFENTCTMIGRIRAMLADRRLGEIISPENADVIKLSRWLSDFLGDGDGEHGHISIIDLSLIPSEVRHVVIAVVARLIFEATQRHMRETNEKACVPTVLVLEEAHTFVKKAGRKQEDDTIAPADMCRQTFEKIAREGRKFGLGLVLSSQRPSELSPTVLAQCNTFLLHRITNDDDQQLVRRLVPDNLAGLLRELPSLPERRAVLLGWATPIPTLVEIRELAKRHRPRSEDPKFWDTWTGEETVTVDWPAIAKTWAGEEPEPDDNPPSAPPAPPTPPAPPPPRDANAHAADEADDEGDFEQEI